MTVLPTVEDRAGGAPAGTGSVRAALPGRDTVADRVYRKIAEATAASVIGIPREEAHVDVAQHRDGIALRVRAPLPVPPLDEVTDTDTPVLDRIERMQRGLRDQVGQQAGRAVVRVDITVTGARIARQRRVR